MKKILIALLGIFPVLSGMYALGQKTPALFRFSFSHKPGFVMVALTDSFTLKKGYGFDFGTRPERLNKDSLGCYATGSRPFYFSVRLPEGTYRVSVLLGDLNQRTVTTLKAESRRLYLSGFVTQAGHLQRKNFLVNLRSPLIGQTNHSVILKPREKGSMDWDDRLTLEFSDSLPSVRSIEIFKETKPVTTVFLAGNSTVVDQPEEPWTSWGQILPYFLDADVVVANHAESGLSLKSFLKSHRLEKILSLIHPGDYLFIEFGHNDQKENGPEDGAWKLYKKNMEYYVDAVRSKGAIPVIVTSTARRAFDSTTGKVYNTLGDFPEAARTVAREKKVTLIDLNKMSSQLYDVLGDIPSRKAFVQYPAGTFPGQLKALADNTHFNPYGAYEIARCVLTGISRSDLLLKKFIRKKVKLFDPSHPDDSTQFHWVYSPALTMTKPDGN